MPISTVWILKYIQQCYVKWFLTISSLGAPDGFMVYNYFFVRLKTILGTVIRLSVYICFHLLQVILIDQKIM